MKGDLEQKINLFLNLLFHQIILIKEINILEYLVLIWTYLIKNSNYEIRSYMTGGSRKWSVHVTTLTAQMILRIRKRSLLYFHEGSLHCFFLNRTMLNKCYVWIKKIMLNLLFYKLGCSFLEHKKKHAGSEIYLKKIGGHLEKRLKSVGEGAGNFFGYCLIFLQSTPVFTVFN